MGRHSGKMAAQSRTNAAAADTADTGCATVEAPCDSHSTPLAAPSRSDNTLLLVSVAAGVARGRGHPSSALG